MRTRTVITMLFCGICLLAAGYTAAESTPTDSLRTVKPEERDTSTGTQGQEAQGEPPSGEIQERAIRQGAGALGEQGQCVCLANMGVCVYHAPYGCVPSQGPIGCNAGCIEQKPDQGFGGTKAIGHSTGTTTVKPQVLPGKVEPVAPARSTSPTGKLGGVIQRGVEGEPATSAPTEQEDNIPAPK